MTDAGGPGSYTCRYCRMSSGGTDLSCPFCGAPVDVTERVTASGWEELPAIADLARIQFGRSDCQVSGLYVPVCDMNLAGDDWVFFSHNVLLWCDTQVELDALSLDGAWNRTLAGMPLVMMYAKGPGHVALSHNVPGETVAIPLHHGQIVDVLEHRFLAATGNVSYTWASSGVWFWTASGGEREQHLPIGRFIDRFTSEGNGLLLLHAPGNVFIRDLAPGQTILIQPSALLYKDASVGLQLHFEYPAGATQAPGSFGLGYRGFQTFLRLSGPGRVAVQSVWDNHSFHYARITSSSPSTQWAWG